MSYTLYIGNKNYSTWSLRGWLLMRASGAPFTEELVSLNANEHDGAYKAFSPSGLVPCLVDGDSIVWDSLSIAEYLHERHPGIWPADAKARAWARSICAEMHSGFRALRGEMGMCIRERVDVRPWSPGLTRDIERITILWNETLARVGRSGQKGTRGDVHRGDQALHGDRGDHGDPANHGENSGLLFGSFSAADAFFAPVAFRFRTYGVEPGGAASAYAKALLAHPYVCEWESAALLETEIVEADEPRIIYREKIQGVAT